MTPRRSCNLLSTLFCCWPVVWKVSLTDIEGAGVVNTFTHSMHRINGSKTCTIDEAGERTSANVRFADNYLKTPSGRRNSRSFVQME